ncbi:hypothetical protein BH24CHL7_BH24CHL7_17300 [soil metagenome]
MGLLSRLVDRRLHTFPPPVGAAGADARRLHQQSPVVDLVVGSALFRDDFLTPQPHGHVDLARLREGGVNLVGLTIATRHPDLRGTLSGLHFHSLGMPRAIAGGGSNMAIAEWLVRRIEAWADGSEDRLRIVRTSADLAACLEPDGPVGAFIGVQGGHVLDGRATNVELLHELGVRMFAPAHVMDNELVGSGTGRRRGGLTAYGREVIARLENANVLVDLAHMSVAGISDSLKVVQRPFVLSHTGLTELSGRASRWRRYSPATRNIPASLAGEVAAAGGLVGVILATQLLGGHSLEHATNAFRLALSVAGRHAVALGSDMDGGLRSVVDAAGLPLLTQHLLASGISDGDVRAVIGGNALRTLAGAFPA